MTDFDINSLSSYREHNRLEAKRQRAVSRVHFGKLIPHLQILMAGLFYLELKKMLMVLYILKQALMLPNYARIFGTW